MDISELRKLESEANEDRGVSCVKSIISYIERGDLQSARTVRVMDGDKLYQYPEIEEWMDNNLCGRLGEPPKNPQ